MRQMQATRYGENFRSKSSSPAGIEKCRHTCVLVRFIRITANAHRSLVSSVAVAFDSTRYKVRKRPTKQPYYFQNVSP